MPGQYAHGCKIALLGKRSTKDYPRVSALSCTLFMAYLNDLPSALRCRKLLYADDSVLWKTEKEAAALQNALQSDLHTISSYCVKWYIKVSTTKTVWSLFSLVIDILKAPFEFTITGRRLNCDNSPKYLGIVLTER